MRERERERERVAKLLERPKVSAILFAPFVIFNSLLVQSIYIIRCKVSLSFLIKLTCSGGKGKEKNLNVQILSIFFSFLSTIAYPSACGH